MRAEDLGQCIVDKRHCQKSKVVSLCKCGENKVPGMFLILLSSYFYFSAKPEGEGKSTCWPFVCLALSHSDSIMALTFSLLFTYHVNRWCQREASLFLFFPSQCRLFIYWPQCHLCFIHVRPDACSRLSFALFFHLQAAFLTDSYCTWSDYWSLKDVRTNGTKSRELKKKKSFTQAVSLCAHTIRPWILCVALIKIC